MVIGTLIEVFTIGWPVTQRCMMIHLDLFLLRFFDFVHQLPLLKPLAHFTHDPDLRTGNVVWGSAFKAARSVASSVSKATTPFCILDVALAVTISSMLPNM